jgi:hypothetical protein
MNDIKWELEIKKNKSKEHCFILQYNKFFCRYFYSHNKTNEWNVFNIDEIAYAPIWDGHTPEEAIKRISLLEKRNNKMENKIVFTSFGFIQANEVLKFCTFNGVEFAKIKYIDGHGVAEIEVKTINGKVNLYGGETIIKTEKGLEVIK